MTVIIPESIKKEILRIGKGRKKKKKVLVEYSKENFLPRAIKNFEFLNAIANTEPIYSFLKDKKIIVLIDFSPRHAKNALVSRGDLLLETISGKTALYYWHDADYPANRSDSDHSLIKEEDLADWHKDSLERFALLTEREIWKAIREFLGVM